MDNMKSVKYILIIMCLMGSSAINAYLEPNNLEKMIMIEAGSELTPSGLLRPVDPTTERIWLAAERLGAYDWLKRKIEKDNNFKIYGYKKLDEAIKNRNDFLIEKLIGLGVANIKNLYNDNSRDINFILLNYYLSLNNLKKTEETLERLRKIYGSKIENYIKNRLSEIVANDAASLSPKMLELLLTKGADPRAMIKDNQNPLYYMLYDLYLALKDNKADLNYLDKWITNLKILLKYGADPKETIQRIGVFRTVRQHLLYDFAPALSYSMDLGTKSKYPAESIAKNIMYDYWRDSLANRTAKTELAKAIADYNLGKSNNPIIKKLQEIVEIMENPERGPYYGNL